MGVTVATLHRSRMGGQPRLHLGQWVKNSPPFTATDSDTRNVAVLRELPKQPRGDTQGLCRLAGTQG